MYLLGEQIGRHRFVSREANLSDGVITVETHREVIHGLGQLFGNVQTMCRLLELTFEYLLRNYRAL